MAKRGVKVRELARELGVSSRSVIDRCRASGIPAQNNITRLSPEHCALLRVWFTDRPKSIAVKLLGPDVARALADRDLKTKTIGYPISVHTWRSGAIPASVEANISQGGDRVEGFVITGRGTRYTAAPGMAVFYPIAPLKSGVSVSVEFRRPNGKNIGSWRFKPK